MTTTYIQRGESLDYVNAGEAKIAAGDVVTIVSHIGIAGTDILPGETGSIEVTGVFEIPKKTASEVIAMGDTVYYNAGITKTASGGILAGYAVEAAGADKATVAVKLMG